MVKGQTLIPHSPQRLRGVTSGTTAVTVRLGVGPAGPADKQGGEGRGWGGLEPEEEMKERKRREVRDTGFTGNRIFLQRMSSPQSQVTAERLLSPKVPFF